MIKLLVFLIYLAHVNLLKKVIPFLRQSIFDIKFEIINIRRRVCLGIRADAPLKKKEKNMSKMFQL